MKKAVVSLIVLAATPVSATALGASSAQNPSRLVLQRSDLPAGATRTTLKGVRGATLAVPAVGSVRPYGVSYHFRRSGRQEAVGSVAFVFSTVKAAKTSLARARRQSAAATFTRFNAPRLGTEQWTVGLFQQQASAAVFVVRKGNVIWETSVSDAPGLARAAAIAEGLKYARKQRARVG